MNLRLAFLIALVTAISGSAQTHQPDALSVSVNPSVTAAGNSFSPQFSADGRFIVFGSHARNLTTNTFLSFGLNIFRHELSSGQTVLVSASSDSASGGDNNSAFYSVSSNGQFIAFASTAANLGPNDTNSAFDIFARDIANRATRLVSADPNSNPPPETYPGTSAPLSYNPHISTDGRWVAFESRATTLDARATAGLSNVFVTDLLSNKTFLVSVNVDGTSASSPSRFPQVSADGRFVTFVSSATNLISEPTGPRENLFRRDLQQGTTTWLSRDLTSYLDASSNGYQIVECAVSADTQVIAYKVNDLQTGLTWVFRYDLVSDSTLLLATNSFSSTTPGISADGRFVAYDAGTNVFVWDNLNQSNILASVDVSGSQAANGTSGTPVLSADGRYVAFVSDASDLVGNAGNGKFQVYWHDLIGGTTRLVSRNTNSTAADASHEFIVPAISLDGRRVAFESRAPDLIADDLNRASDVFVYDVEGDTLTAISKSVSPPSTTGPGSSSVRRNAIRTDGKLVVFSSDSYTTNGATSLILHDLGSGSIRVLKTETNLLIDPELSADGRYVTYTRRNAGFASQDFHDDALRHNLVSGTNELLISVQPGISDLPRPVSHVTGSNGAVVVLQAGSDLYLHDFDAATNVRISINAVDPQSHIGSPALSQDNQKLVFLEYNAVYLKVLTNTAAPRLVSHSPTGANAIAASPRSVTISGDSRSAVFGMSSDTFYLYRYQIESDSVSLICTECQNGSLDYSGALLAYESRASDRKRSVYLRDLENGQNTLLSGPADLGLPPETPLDSWSPIISGDGRFVLFLSRITASATNIARLYLRDRAMSQTLLLTPNPEGIGLVTRDGAQLSLSRDGRTALFRSFASDLVSGDYNDKRDVFIVRLGSGDSDGDGMDDDWEMAYFETLARDGAGDFDEDGQTDLQEFRAGTDPTNKDSVLRAITVAKVGGATTVFWNAVPGRSYRVEFKENVEAIGWDIVSGQVQTSGSTGWIDDTTASSSSHRFYRVVQIR